MLLSFFYGAALVPICFLCYTMGMLSEEEVYL